MDDLMRIQHNSKSGAVWQSLQIDGEIETFLEIGEDDMPILEVE
jgi:hypothetical protein